MPVKLTAAQARKLGVSSGKNPGPRKAKPQSTQPAVKYLVESLPYPPSVNHYWRHVGNETLISKEGREYREKIDSLLYGHGCVTGRLVVEIAVWTPDRRRRDLDNILKSLLDSLQHAGAIEDDGSIDMLVVSRKGTTRDGRVVVSIHPMA